jgi:hypothetical protein
MHHADCHDALTRLVKVRPDLLVASLLRLKDKHRIYQLEAVLNPVVHLLHKKVLLDDSASLSANASRLRVQLFQGSLLQGSSDSRSCSGIDSAADHGSD